jgi:group I intron endonuclease
MVDCRANGDVMTDYRNRIKAGIYTIRNKDNGKVYVGSSQNVGERWRTHRKQLKAQRHANGHLQAAWNSYGEDAFDFVVIEAVDDPDRLIEREQYWMDEMRSTDHDTGYNMKPFADSSRGRRAGAEERARLSAAKKGNKYALGTKQSQETIDKRRKSLTGRTWKMSEERKQSPEHRAWRERHAEMMRGRKHDWHTSIPEDTRAKIGASVKQARAANLKTYAGFVDPDGNEVEPIKGLEDFCRERGLSRQNMDAVYRGKRNSHRGWTVKRD